MRALKFASLGWPVFACEVGGKRPHPRLSPKGFHDATTDIEKVKAIWREEPTANVGISCGPVVILDIDVKGDKRGDVELAELVREHGPIGDTRQAWTPSGGMHFYFSVPDGVRVPRTIGKFAPSIDVLGWGGYAVGPGSEVQGVGRYEWACSPQKSIVDPSPWVLERMLAGGLAEVSKPPAIRQHWDRNSLSRVERAVRYVDAMPEAISGSGGHVALLKVACAVVRGFDLPDAMAIEVLRHYSQRCSPPWAEKDLWHKIEEAKRARLHTQGDLAERTR